MSEMSVSFINNVLGSNGFILAKGDAGRVAQAMTATGSGDAGTILRCASELGLQRRERSGRSGKNRNVLSDVDEALLDAAAFWVAGRAAAVLERGDATDIHVTDVLDEALRRSLPGDVGKWATIGDFLDEPSAVGVAVYGDGIEVPADTVREELQARLEASLHSVLRGAAAEAASGAPPTVAETIRMLENKGKLGDFIGVECNVAATMAGMDDMELLARIEGMPFMETLLAKYPGALQTLEANAAAAKQAENRLTAAAASIAASFEGRRVTAPDAYKVANAIVSYFRSGDDVPLVRRLFAHGCISAITTRSARKQISEMADAWLDQIADRRIDFHSRLADLFRCLDEARTRERRQWFVTVTQDCATSRFSEDNWAFFALFAATGGVAGADSRFSVVIRRFEPLKDEDSGLPYKSIGGVLMDGRDVMLLKADEIRMASSFHCRTGEQLEREEAVRFVDMAALCPAFAESLKRPDPTTEAGVRSFLRIVMRETDDAGCFASVDEGADGTYITVTSPGSGHAYGRLFPYAPELPAGRIRDITASVMPVGVLSPAPIGSGTGIQAAGRQPGFVPQIIPGGKT